MSVAGWEQVRRSVARWVESGLGPGWVVAVSGGSDSVGLLRALHGIGPALGLRLSVAHLDHGVRADAGREDARFVAELAARLGLPFDLGQWSPSRAGHFEADARKARYGWLTEVARARGASVVAVGHTRDDQAETILHRVVRGTGLRGLAGMPMRRPLAEGVTLVRPLLKVSRRTVRAELAGLEQGYREDASNRDQARTRARIRHDLLPRLAAEYNPKVAEALVRLGGLAAASARLLEREQARAANEVTVEAGPRAVVFRKARLSRLARPLRVEAIRLAWRRAGWPEAGMDARRWNRLAGLVRRDRGRFSVGSGIDAWISADLVRLAPAASGSEAPGPSEPLELPCPGSVRWGDGRVVTTLEPGDPHDETIDGDRLVGPLSVRAARPGDRFQPLGMGGRFQPLNDFFRGRRVARAERGGVPLVLDGAGIVWVAGHRIADRVRLTATTSRPLGLRWEPEAGRPGAGAG